MTTTTLDAGTIVNNRFVGKTRQMPRPTREANPYQDDAWLREAQKEWDAAEDWAKQNVQRRADHIAAVEAARQARQEADAAAELAALKERHRTAYLAQPGATESGFEAAWPRMLEEHRIDEATHGADRLLEEARRLTPAAF